MSRYKDNVKPMHAAKNAFVKWLEEKDGTNIKASIPDTGEPWNYYCTVDGFIGEVLYIVYFTVWQGMESIDYRCDGVSQDNISIDEFLKLIE